MDWEEEINEVRLTGDTEHWGRIEKKLSMDGLRGENEVRMDWEEKQKKDGLKEETVSPFNTTFFSFSPYSLSPLNPCLFTFSKG